MIKPLLTIKKGKPTYIAKPPNYEAGFNRCDTMSMLDNDNDWSAVLEYLTQFQGQPNTLLNYSKEVERFLLWLIYEKNKPLSAVNRADWMSYLEFIKAPHPNWCSSKQKKFLDKERKELNPNWRPFEISQKRSALERANKEQRETELVSGLSESSQQLAKRIVESMYNFLVVAGHLNANPAMSPRTRNRTAKAKKSFVERAISVDLIDFTIDCLYAKQRQSTTKPDKFKYLRARYIIQLLAGTGLRIAEAASHSYANVRVLKDDKWMLDIIGKGEKPRTIELFPDLKAVIKEFRETLGCNPTPLYKDPVKLIPAKNIEKDITTRRIIQIMRESFDLACLAKQSLAAGCNNKDEKALLLRESSILASASAHWLRHAHATYFLKYTNNDLKRTMTRMGHSSIDTTQLYIHDLED